MLFSSVTATLISRSLLGNFPSFVTPPHELISYWELPLYLVLGIFAGLVAMLYILSLHHFERFFGRLTLPVWLKPALGGLLVGLIGLNFPRIMGTGFPTIEDALQGKFLWFTLALLLVFKLLSTSLSLGSGASGGIIAPALFLGATLGGAFGELIKWLLPGATTSSGAFALVGMGAFLGASAQAPFTAILILFEMTGDYRLILPLMAAVGVGYLVQRRFLGESMFTYSLALQGIHYRAGRDEDIMGRIPVKEALTHRLDTCILENITIEELLQLIKQTEHEWFLVLNPAGEIAGVITLLDVQKALAAGKSSDTAAQWATREVINAYPDESLKDVLVRFDLRDLGHLPVVERENPKKMVGIISRLHVIKAYNRALSSKTPLAPSARGTSDKAR